MANIYAQVDEAQLKQDAASTLLHYGAEFYPDIITRAEGIYIYTASGHRMLDWTSGQMSCLIGHGHPEIVEVIKRHAQSLDHLFSGMISPPVIALAKRLVSLTPPGLDRALFLSTGGESNEAAIRLAKSYTGKYEVVGLSASWHGMGGAAMGAQYTHGRAGFGPVLPGNFVLQAPNPYRSIFRHADGTHDWETELEYGFSLIDKQSCGSLAAVIVEPIQASGGTIPLPRGYLSKLKEYCRKRGMLLITDEAQTAIGRGGDMFAFQHDGDGFVPDILTLSKTLGNGMALSAVMTSEEIAQTAKEKGFHFYTTHMNDPLPAAVGDKVLEVVVRDGLVEQAREKGKFLQAGLRRLQDRYGCIGEVRGRGLMAGVEIVLDRATKKPGFDLGDRIAERMAELGLWLKLGMQASFAGVYRIAPPIITTQEQLQEGLDIMEQAFAETEGSMPLYRKSPVELVQANL
ncbi:pyridoxal phosphate-dependent transferase [Massariosphaeria phaeospora]|uniref:Pyridoxal phosphate-dependent transferase n=1 Tax=Massariosphaeria phaeospora TaxID=100035 RepID=A0A7C8MIX8_9PLEO|nr:pyridoxal phosphate-dependent transferase [Massariosphaeria phaeospora]